MIEKIGHKAVLIYPEFDTKDTFWSYSSSLEMYAQPGEFGLPKRKLKRLRLNTKRQSARLLRMLRVALRTYWPGRRN